MNSANFIESEKKNFVNHINDVLYEVSGIKFHNNEDFRKAPYEAKLADALISTARTMILVSNSNDLQYLEQYADWAANYLADYIKQDPKHNGNYSQAFVELKSVLFDNSQYINNMRSHQKEQIQRETEELNSLKQDAKNQAVKFFNNTKTMKRRCLVRATTDGALYSSRKNSCGQRVVDEYYNERKRYYVEKYNKLMRNK